MIIYNGDLIQENQLEISIDDRALEYGDGVFETIIFRNGSIRFLHDHALRLREALNAISIDQSNINEGSIKRSISLAL